MAVSDEIDIGCPHCDGEGERSVTCEHCGELEEWECHHCDGAGNCECKACETDRAARKLREVEEAAEEARLAEIARLSRGIAAPGRFPDPALAAWAIPRLAAVAAAKEGGA